MPTLTFVISGTSFPLPPSAYMLQVRRLTPHPKPRCCSRWALSPKG